MSYTLNFAPHLGFPTPATPLFADLAGDAGMDAQIAFIAECGFRALQDPFAARRSEDDQQRVGTLAAAAGLDVGCFVSTPIEQAFAPRWSATDPAGQAALDREIDTAIAIGKRIGSRHIAVLNGTDATRDKAEQRAAMAANLRRQADRAADAGMIIVIEPVNGHRLPQMLLHHLADGMEVIALADHPAVRLIFDFAHVQSMDGNILANMHAVWDKIELFQLADNPDRVEPGAGELNFLRILDEIVARGFDGIVELEHGWSAPGADVQRAYLDWLNRWKTPAA